MVKAVVLSLGVGASTIVPVSRCRAFLAALRAGLVHQCVSDEDLMTSVRKFAEKAASAPKELLTRLKQTVLSIGEVTSHTEAVRFELEPQLWSTRQPWFEERLAALQAKISKR